jgi:hypothetical protein
LFAGIRGLLGRAVADGVAPGAAALVGRGGSLEIASAGDLEPGSIVRIASITKPITAAAGRPGARYGWIGGTGTTAHIDPPIGPSGFSSHRSR